MLLPLVSIIMLAVINANECPDNCECTNDAAILFANASSISVKCSIGILPKALPRTATRLELHGIHLLNSDSEHLQLPHLTFVDCVVSDVFSLGRFEGIESLYLSGSNLNYLNGSFNSSRLKTLALPHNEISLIENGPFNTLSSLKVLNLSSNAIQTLGNTALEGLINLRTLDLSFNKIAVIRNEMFLPAIQLQFLNLSYNVIEELRENNLNTLQRLQQLDASYNRLSRVAPGSLELPSLARLLLAGNSALRTFLVGPGKRLQTLDASRTGLKQVPAALTHSVRTLRLAGNSIQTVSCGDLDSYPLLQLLDLNSNQLENVEDDALGRLDLLSILYLSNNSLKNIPRDLPENLRILHLEKNKIGQVEEDDLKGLTNLEGLHLSDNHIKKLGYSAFIHLVALATLDLSRNPISILPEGILSGPWKLQVLRLANLDVVSPAKEMSFPLPFPEHLVTLDLSHSPNLAHQILADTAALAAARELQELNLEGGDLQRIRSDLLHFLPQLRVLRLRDNPLDCNHLHWLAIWMRRQDQPQHREAVCSHPSEFSDSLLIDLQDSVADEPVVVNNSSFIQHATTTAYKTTANHLTPISTQSPTEPPNTTPEVGKADTTTINTTPTSEIPSVPNKFDQTSKSSSPVDMLKTFIPTKLIRRGKTVKESDKIRIQTSNSTRANEVQLSTERYTKLPIATTAVVSESKVSPQSANLVLQIPQTVNADSASESLQTLDFHSLVKKTFGAHVSFVENNGLPSSVTNGGTQTTSPASQPSNTRTSLLVEEPNSAVTSMFTSESDKHSVRAGLLVLAVASVLGAVTMTILTTSRCQRHKRRPIERDIEVNSLPSVTELW